MQFRHEIYKSRLKDLQKELINVQKKINHPKEEELILWEVGTELNLNPVINSVFWTGSKTIKTYIKGSISAYVFELILDEIDEMLEPYGYHLMLIKSKFDAWDNTYNYYFCKDKDQINKSYIHDLTCPYICITFTSSQCKQVPTGKMIPETKSVCTMIN